MASTASEQEEATAKGKMAGTAQSSVAKDSGASSSPAKPRNAFTELMKHKPKPTPPSAPAPPPKASSLARVFRDRDGLGAYLADPTAFPASRVIYHNASFVAIHDMYPKASVHCLLLPRSPDHVLQHPFDAFDDADFLAAVRAEAATLKRIVVSELQRIFGPYSAGDRQRQRVLSGELAVEPPAAGGQAQLPPGRDWAADVRVGVHAHPSMNHLHVHVLSRDMHSQCVRHRKHYNSFNTPFLVDLADFPLAADDPRTHPGRRYMDQSLKCWRCGKDFGNRFKELKAHLEVEFEAWKKE